MAVDPTNPLMNNAVLQNLIKPTDPSGGVPAMAGATVMDQPIEVRLKYGSSFHAEILSRLNARQMLSERNMTMRYDDWQRVDEHCRLYIDLSRSARRSDKSSNTNKKEMPWERAIVVPMSYAILQVEMTQVMGIFMRRDPILEVMGAGPEDIRPAKVMQSVLGYDQNQTRFPLQLFSASQNAFKYGLGSMYDCWNDQYGWKFNKRPPNPMLDYLGVPEVTRTWDLIKQYNQVESVDPYNYWPDPRCSMTDVQNMEFVGHRVWRGFLYVLERSQENGGPYFNIEALRRTIGGSRRDVRVRNRFQTTQHLVMSGSQDDQDKGFHALDHMQVKLVPKTWKLGDGDKPEIWWFTVVDKTIIIRAHQSQYWHGEFSYSGMESNFDPHVTFNPGDIENLDGIQRFMNWHYNCFSEDTEVLTERGWSKFQDLEDTDKVATVSTDDERNLWFEQPARFFTYDFDGEMVQIGGDGRQRFDLLVTPNHKMWVSKRKLKYGPRTMIDGNTVRKYEQGWWTDSEFIEANAMKPRRYRIPNTVSWDGGVKTGALILPAASTRGVRGRPYDYPELLIPYEVLAPFIGWYVSEGSVTKGYVKIGQKNPKLIPVIDELLSRFPKKFARWEEKKRTAVRWQCHDWRLANWLRDNCGAGSKNKRLPRIVWKFDRCLLRSMLSAALAGDGHQYRDNLSIYHSTSKQLIDDFQVAALRAGFEASARVGRKPKATNHTQAHYLNLVDPQGSGFRQAIRVSRRNYKGKVYCIENSTHLTVVRRNGKAAISGNSHVQNVWRHLNNSMIYAPTLVEEIDILNPTAAGHFRLSALGEKLVQEGRITIDQIVHQLNLHDVTGGMLGDVNQLFDWGMRMTGAADQFQGVNPEQDRTLGENQQVVAGGSSRMAMRAGIIETTGILPTGRRMISNRQQFTTEEQFFAITGDLARELQTDRLSVTPDQIQGNLDMVPRSNPEPPDAGEMRQSWEALAAVLGQNPALLTMPDSMGRVPDPQELFKEYARSGLKIRNIESYYRQLPPPPMPVPTRVLPDEQVQQMKQAGNIIPLRPTGT